MSRTKSATAALETPAPEPATRGVGGSYTIDAVTGARVQTEPPTQPPPDGWIERNPEPEPAAPEQPKE